MSAQKHKEGSIDLSFSGFKKRWKALLHFRTPLPPIIIDDWSWKKRGWKLCRSPNPNLGGYESAILKETGFV